MTRLRCRGGCRQVFDVRVPWRWLAVFIARWLGHGWTVVDDRLMCGACADFHLQSTNRDGRVFIFGEIHGGHR